MGSSRSERRGAVYIREEEECGLLRLGEWWLLGTYDAFQDIGRAGEEPVVGLSRDEAVAWARDRSDQVWLDVEGERVWVGTGDPPRGAVDGRPRLAEAAPRRRRHPSFAFLDRPPDADPMDWSVVAWVGVPPQPSGVPDRVPEMDGVVAALSDAVGGRWDRKERDGFQADQRAAARRARGAEYGWTTYHREEYRVRLGLEASTYEGALAAAAARFTLPDGVAIVELRAVPEGWRPPYDGDDTF